MVDASPAATPVTARSRSGSESPKEDAATKSAREELKHTAISEKLQINEGEQKGDGDIDAAGSGSPDASKTPDDPKRAVTPVMSEHADDGVDLRDRVTSPKKKRGHDEVDNDGDSAVPSTKTALAEAPATSVTDSASLSFTTVGSSRGGTLPGSGNNSAVALSPNGRAEPEKKRLRDGATEDSMPDTDKPSAPSALPSTLAFSSSGFAKLSSTSSPFGSLGGGAGAAGKPIQFGSISASASPSPFGAFGGTTPAPAPETASAAADTKPEPTPAAAAPKLTFGSTAAASPFAQLPSAGAATKVFGSGFGGAAGGTGGFGSAFGSAGTGGSAFGAGMSGGLASFAKPGEAFKSSKPTRPFGAPESDEDEGEEGEEGEDADDGAADVHDEDEAGEDGGDSKDTEDRNKDKKKKQKLHKVAVDDGEAGEATLLQVRSRMYYLDKDEGGWKERGAGMLKVNVPQHCVEYDSDGTVIPASFDASTLLTGGDDDDRGDGADECATGDDKEKEDSNDRAHKERSQQTGVVAVPKRTVVRLIMRQDSTHRVLLNTVLLAATEFTERQTLKATTVLFTAFEGPEAKPVSVQMKMNINNAKTFLSAMEGIQRELRGN